MATDRATLRASLKRKTDNQLTASADQDIYLDLADRQVQSDWIQFDKSILRYSRDSAATDANGILLMDAEFVELERLEMSDKTKLPRLKIEERWNRRGYYYAGWGNSNTQRQLQVMDAGSVMASKTLYFYAMKLSPMAAGTTAEPVIPEEKRDLIAVKAAELWYREQTPSLINVAEKHMRFYESELEKARRAYRSIDDEPMFMSSDDPDAGGGQPVIIHNT